MIKARILYLSAFFSFALLSRGQFIALPSPSVCQLSSISATAVPPSTANVASSVWWTSTSSTLSGLNSNSTQVAATLAGCGTATIFCNLFDNNSMLIGSYSATVQVVCSSMSLSPSAQTVCANASATITASGAASYSWSNGSGSNSIVVNPSTHTIYSVSAPSVACPAFATVSVFSPTIVLPSPSVCPGTQATLAAIGGTNYSWLNQSNNVVGTGSMVVVTPTALPANYTLISTWGGACLAMLPLTLDLKQLSVYGSAPSSVCANSNATLTAFGPATHTWVVGTQNFTGNSFVHMQGAPETYTLLADSAGCKGTQIFTVGIFPNPALSITANAYTICVPQSATLTAAGALNFTWTAQPSIQSALYGPSVTVTPSITTVYTVTGADINGCKGSAQQTVQIGFLPTTLVGVSDPVVCAGFFSTLTASGAQSYLWSSPNSTAPVSGNTLLAGPGSFTVTGSNGGSCTDLVVVTVNLAPPLALQVSQSSPGTCRRPKGDIEPVQFSVSGANSYTWAPYVPGQMTYSIGSSTAVTPSVSTCYTVTGSTSTCAATATLCVEWGNCLSVFDMVPRPVRIFPNPFQEKLNVESELPLLGFAIFRIDGSLVREETLHSASMSLSLGTSDLEPGLYYFRALAGDQCYHLVISKR